MRIPHFTFMNTMTFHPILLSAPNAFTPATLEGRMTKQWHLTTAE